MTLDYTIYQLKWADTALPPPSSIDVQVTGLGVEKRTFSGRKITLVYQGNHKHKWTIGWDGASSLERKKIIELWEKEWHRSNGLYIIDSDVATGPHYNAKSTLTGYKEVYRYNPLLNVWRYKITLVLEEY